MSYQIGQSLTSGPLVFFMADSADHVTGKTGLTPTVNISKNGGSLGSPSGTVSEIGSGFYKVAGNATDSNTLGPLALYATAAGADPCHETYFVIKADPTQNATQKGDSYSEVTNITYGLAKLVRATTPANTLDITSTGEVGLDFSNLRSPAVPTTISNLTISAVTTLTNAPTAGDFTTAMKASLNAATPTSVGSVTGSVGSVTGAVGSVTGSVGSVVSDVGITQAAADKVWNSTTRTLTTFGTLVADVWDRATSLLTTTGSVGKKFVDDFNTLGQQVLAAMTRNSQVPDLVRKVAQTLLLQRGGLRPAVNIPIWRTWTQPRAEQPWAVFQRVENAVRAESAALAAVKVGLP